MTVEEKVTSPGVFANLWRQKWLIVWTSALTLAATAVGSHYFLPVRYWSEGALQVVPMRMPLGDAPLLVRITAERIDMMSHMILSRTRLERLIEELELYEADRASQPIEDLVLRMRSEIAMNVTRDERTTNGIGGFRVGFVSASPETAMKVTQRLMSQFVEENLRDAQRLVDGSVAFITVRIEDLRRQVDESERTLAKQREKGGRAAQADIIESEVRQETLRALLVKQQQLTHEQNLQRRQIGEQLRVVEPARVPTRPISPDRFAVNTAGGAVGLMIGLVLATIASVRRRRRD